MAPGRNVAYRAFLTIRTTVGTVCCRPFGSFALGGHRHGGRGDRLGALREVGSDPARFPGQLNVLQSAQKLPVDGTDLHAGQVCTETEVSAKPESEVGPGLQQLQV
jgi:hypothetical protein